MEYKITIPGKPFAKQRPRHGKGFTYTPKETVNYEVLIKTIFQAEYGQPMLEGELFAYVTAFFEIPKSTSKKGREAMLSGEVRPKKKPDVDNIAKSVLDSLNGIAYKDDSQIVSLGVDKFYSENPRVTFMVSTARTGGEVVNGKTS